MRSLVFNVLFYALSFACAAAAWVAAKAGSRAATRAVMAWWCRRVLGLVRRVLGGRVEVRGTPPKGPVILAPKHQSELDAILIFSLYPDLSAVAMKELERYPFVGAIIRRLDLITVAVDAGPQGRTAAVVEGAREALAAGRPVLIYPEGTLMSLGARERYRTGVWRIHAATGAAVVPVAMSLGAIWPRREWRKRAGRVGAVRFLEPMPVGFDEAGFMAELESRVEQATMALIREHADGADLAAAEDRFARGAANED